MWYCVCSFHWIRCLVKCHSKTPISSFPSWLINIWSWPFQWIGATLSWKSRLHNYASKQTDYWSPEWRREALAKISGSSDLDEYRRSKRTLRRRLKRSNYFENVAVLEGTKTCEIFKTPLMYQRRITTSDIDIVNNLKRLLKIFFRLKGKMIFEHCKQV